MIYAIDVQYYKQKAVVASIGFESFKAKKESYKRIDIVKDTLPYVSGEFYQRELPCLLEALKDLDDIELVIVDGYVWLGEPTHRGLGFYLYEALDKRVPIIGVAKSKFAKTPKECEIFRGESKKPLYITSIDISLEDAKSAILNMSGEYRLPTLLKMVDSLARSYRF